MGGDARGRLSQATLEAGSVKNGLITLKLNSDIVSDLLSMNDFESISATVAGATYKLAGIRYAYDIGLPGEIIERNPHIYFDPVQGATGDIVTIHVARSRNSQYLDENSENLN
ncbi:hypothetical protein ACFQZT_13530 [Paenibacillus sp. GCM10027628]|uniref:hypothetical protein n=1 Tax=Paenibacillus sp. GCM10027628 TaxID=3273413 RepID=UPI00362920C4